MRNVHNWVRVSLGVAVATACLSACGGVTDIDFQGVPADSGVAGGGAGSGGSSAGGGAGGGTAATGNVGGGGTAGSGAGGSGGVGGGSAGGTGGGALVCGNEECSTPSVPIGQVDSCCAGDKCGISSSLLGNQCIEQDQPGTADPNCPPQTVQGFTLQGCCKPTGICGVLDTFIGLGCVDPSQFGGPPGPACGGGAGGSGGTGGTGGSAGTGGVGATGGTGGSAGGPGTSCGTTSPDVCSTGTEKCCVLDPGIDYCEVSSADCACTGPNCTTLPVSCDGSEDCPGQICCGTFSFAQNRYVSVQCENSCAGPTKREVCHLGQQCLNPNHTCSPSAGLPANLNRCN